MINENNKILKVKINKENSYMFTKFEEIYEGFNSLFYFILKDPFDNFWWECISITFQYCQLLIFIINRTVSGKIFFI